MVGEGLWGGEWDGQGRPSRAEIRRMSRSQVKMGGTSIEGRKAFLWERTQSVSKTGRSGWSCKESEAQW